MAFVWQAFQVPNTLQLPEDFKREIEPYLDAEKKTEKHRNTQLIKQIAGWSLGLFFCLMLAEHQQKFMLI